MRRTAAWATVGVLLCSSVSPAGEMGVLGRPRLDLRATPRLAFSPVRVFFVAELKGGDDVEEFYCPGLEWEWGDGSRSGTESDCTPFEPGGEVQRFYSAHHAYRAPGEYEIKLRMKRQDHTVALATVSVVVQGPSAAGE
jgi:hypothetical protein